MKKGYVKKIIKLLIIIIIPLAAAAVTASYAYNRYKDHFFNYYMSEASETNTEDRLVTYLEYINESIEYTKKDEGYDFFYSNDFKNENGDLFTLSIVRTNRVKNEAYYNKKGTYQGMRDNYYLTYYFAIYNVHYDALAKTLDSTEEHKLLYTELPKLSITLTDAADAEKNQTFDLSTVATVSGNDDPSNATFIYDYGYTPELDSRGDKLNGTNPTNMRYYVLNADKIEGYSTDVEVKVEVKSNWTGDDQVTEEVAKFTKDNMFDNKDLIDNKPVQKELDTFNKGYDKDIYEAGYFKFAVGHYIWWECLIAFAIFELVCGGFVLVWSSEEKKDNTKEKGKKK